MTPKARSEYSTDEIEAAVSGRRFSTAMMYAAYRMSTATYVAKMTTAVKDEKSVTVLE